MKKTILYIIDSLERGGAEIMLVAPLADIHRLYNIILVTLTPGNAFSGKELIYTKQYCLQIHNSKDIISAPGKLKKIIAENSVDLVIPSSEAAKHAIDPSAVQTVSINRDGLIQFNTEATDLARLETDLVSMKAARPEVAVVIRSHKELAVQKLIEVMDAVQRAQISKIGVVTNPEEGGGK